MGYPTPPPWGIVHSNAESLSPFLHVANQPGALYLPLANLVLLGLLWLILGRWRPQRPGLTTLAVGFALLLWVGAIAGIVAWGGNRTAVGQTSATAGRVNPFPADDWSIGIGRDRYAADCAKCHGPSGHGDGRLAAGQDPAPSNLVIHVPQHSDGELFDFVAGGSSHGEMPRYRGELTDEEIWHLVNYMRTLR